MAGKRRSWIPISCYNSKHKVDDIRNGILMDSRLHYQFTIHRNNDVFRIETAPTFHSDDPELSNLDNKIITFGNNCSLWPNEMFLNNHNSQFTYIQNLPPAERPRVTRRRTELTIGRSFESKHRSTLKWITEQSNIKYDELTDVRTVD